MWIKKVHIENYKSLETFDLEFNNDLNILVGNNESGKSTLLEAINLALTCQLNGKNLFYEISPYLFTKRVVNEYLAKLRDKKKPEPPRILIELYFEDVPELATLKGSNNSKSEDATGVSLCVEYDSDFQAEYERYIDDPSRVTTLPTEYYGVNWLSFAYGKVTAKSLPFSVAFIDATSIRLQGGADAYIQNTINNVLDAKEKTELSIAYRKLKESFAEEASLKKINEKLKKTKGDVSTKALTVSIDISQKTSWETTLASYLDDVPFQFVGKGEQSIVKILLALEHQIGRCQLVLIEEPENHLSFSLMCKIIATINEKCEGKQLIISTHSTFVSNKLGLDKLILLGKDGRHTTLNALSKDTQDYFRKLPGYDTLRMLLATKAILVEGPSDELLVQRAYVNKHNKLPIDDGIDVISLRALSFKRFLEIAQIVQNNVVAVIDNDGDWNSNIKERYKEHATEPCIKVCSSKDNTLKTLEDHMAACNTVDNLNAILGTSFKKAAELATYMKDNKTESALKLFSTKKTVNIPDYLNDAIE